MKSGLLSYPKAHAPVTVNWHVHGGGIRATAYTTGEGEPYLAVAGFDHTGSLTTPREAFYASHYRGTAVLGDGSFAYRVPFLVIVSPHELLLFVEPPPELGLTHQILSTPWAYVDPVATLVAEEDPRLPEVTQDTHAALLMKELVP